jgi:hypothetical protein
MNDQDLDERAERLGLAVGRRSLIKGALGVGGAIVVGAGIAQESQAARRGYSGPKIPESNGRTWIVEINGAQEGDFSYQARIGSGPNPLWILFHNNLAESISVVFSSSSILDLMPLSADYERFALPGQVRFYARYPDGRRGPESALTIPA